MTHIPRILIVAQDHNVRNFIQIALAPRGFILRLVLPGVPILEAVAQTAADLVLVDTTNPDNVAQCQTIQRSQPWETLPIVFLVHAANDADRAETDSTEDVFLLPGQAEDLVRQVHTLLQRRHPEYFDARSPRKPILRGFVHEISNTLTSNMLVLTTAFEAEKTLSAQNTEYLYQLFDRIEPFLPQDIREQVLDDLNHIDQNDERLDRMIRLLNDANDRAIWQTKLVAEYAKLEYLPMTIQPLMLDQELTAVLRHYQENFDEQRIAVAISGACAQPLFGHRLHIQALFKHLLNNAYDAFLDRTPADLRRISVTFSQAETTRSIRIDDNAGGIPPIHLPEVFEPFYTTHPKTHAGLGLCFAAKLVSLYGGTITLESAVGDGTCVELAFPLSAVSSPDFQDHE